MDYISPPFPLYEPQHFSDYGFDPHIDLFQFLEEARDQKNQTPVKSVVDSCHFRLQKPCLRQPYEDNKRGTKRVWTKILLVFKWRKWVHLSGCNSENDTVYEFDREEKDVHKARAKALRTSMSGPIYITKSRSSSSTPSRSRNRSYSGPLGTSDDFLDISYLSLRELNREHQQMTSSLYSVS